MPTVKQTLPKTMPRPPFLGHPDEISRALDTSDEEATMEDNVIT